MVSRTAAIPTTTTNKSTGSTAGTTNTVSNTNSNTSTNQSANSSSNTTNMTASGLAALDALIGSLSSSLGGQQTLGGKTKSSDSSQAYTAQIGKLNQLAADYSKANAFSDSDVAVQGALAQALEKSMPTITAGIQAAGTSGSAMSALLTQKAAEDASVNAAQLGVNAAISYGNIQANALASAGTMIDSGDPAMNQLLQALGINKGSVTNTNQSSNASSNSATSSSTVASTDAAQTQAADTTSTTGSTKAATATPAASTTNALSSSGQNWFTPSSYQDSGYQAGKTSYSQFG